MPGVGQTRTARNGIPKVNENPRPPNERRPKKRKNRFRIQKRLSRYVANQSKQNPVKQQPQTTSLDPTKVQQDLASKQVGAGDMFKFSSFHAGPGQEDPRDETYWSNLNKLMFSAQQEYSGNLLEQSYADTDYGLQQGDMTRQRGREQRSLGEEAMRSGLTRSGWLDRTDAEGTTDYLRNVMDFGGSKQREDAARQAARSAIAQGYSVDEAAALAEASARSAQSNLDQATEGRPEFTRKDAKMINRLLNRGLKEHRRARGVGGKSHRKGHKK